MAILSIKTFDDELLKYLKAAAALKGLTLQEHTENLLWGVIGIEKKRPANQVE